MIDGLNTELSIACYPNGSDIHVSSIRIPTVLNFDKIQKTSKRFSTKNGSLGNVKVVNQNSQYKIFAEISSN